MTSALSYAVWALLGLATLVLWALSHRSASGRLRDSGTGRAPERGPGCPALVLERLATGPILRVVLVLGWAWAGWHLFAR